MIWKRSGQVTFTFVSFSKLSYLSHQQQHDFSSILSSFSTPHNSITERFSTSCSNRSSNNTESGINSPDVQQEGELFGIIKTYCSGRPNLLKRVVHWGLQVRKDQEPSVPINVNMKSLKKIASGRLWVSCMLCDTHVTIGCHGNICPEQDALDNMKGAYQEIVKGSGI